MLARAVNQELGASATVVETLDRRRALDGADFVICTVGVGGIEATRQDLLIPEEFGVRQTIGDSLGVGGIFRAARSIPVLLQIAHEMEELCPDALLINYMNPMAMNVLALQRGSRIQSVGLCHGLEFTARTLRTYIDLLDRDEPEKTINAFVDKVWETDSRYGKPWTSWYLRAEDPHLRHVCIGINHMVFFLKLSSGQRDLYPALRVGAHVNLWTYRHVNLWTSGIYCHIGVWIERVKAVSPDLKPGAHSAAQPMTAGQTAGRSGRDPQHVALSSLTAFTPSLWRLIFSEPA